MRLLFLPIHGMLGRVAQSVARLTQEPDVPGSIHGPATYFRFSSLCVKKGVISYWRKYAHEVQVRKIVVRLTDHRCLPWT